MIGVFVGITRVVSYRPSSADRYFDDRYPVSVGFAFGQVLAQDFPQGGHVAVVDEPFQGGKHNFPELHHKGLKLGSQGVNFTFTAVSTSELAEETDEEHVGFPRPPIMGADAFVQAFGNRQDLTAIVSFCGLPEGVDARLIGSLPPLYLANQSSLEWTDEALLKQPQIRAIIALKPSFPLRVKLSPRASMEHILQQRYTLLR
jgi:hypothetical protein